jgi:hypothetical protein
MQLPMHDLVGLSVNLELPGMLYLLQFPIPNSNKVVNTYSSQQIDH